MVSNIPRDLALAAVKRANDARRALSDLHADSPEGWARYRAVHQRWQALRDEALLLLGAAHDLL